MHAKACGPKRHYGGPRGAGSGSPTRYPPAALVKRAIQIEIVAAAMADTMT